MKKILTIAAMLSLLTGGLKAQVILQDSFNYADGVTPVVSGGLWVAHSGTAGNSFVKSSRLEVFGSRGDDVNRPFTNTLTSTIAYASYIVNSTNLSNTTNYFSHFMVNSTTFKCKVFAAGLGVAPNTWRLGISAAGNAGTQATFPLDLATNVDYRVVTSYDTVNRVAALWVDPVSATDANVVPADTTTAATIVGYGFRQSSPNPNLSVDDLYVGNAFADVVVGTPKAPVIYYQPVAGPTTNFVGNSMTLSCVAGGAGTVTFQWQHKGTNNVSVYTNVLEDVNNVGAASNVLALVAAVNIQSGSYKCIVTSTTNSIFAGSVTSLVAQVSVIDAPVPPAFVTQPVSQTVYRGQTTTLTTTVIGPTSGDPVVYTWYSNNVVVTDGQADNGHASSFVINPTTAYTATYKVAATNAYGGVVSTNAVLTVLTPPQVSIGYLRTLVDPTTFVPTNVTANLPYQVTGIVTTYTNITTGNTSSYYLQDGTGGINIFATFGSTFRPLQGDQVTFVGVLSSFTSGLELVADTTTKPYTSYTVNSSGNVLPTPVVIPFTLTNTSTFTFINTNLAGKLVTLQNVYFGTNAASVLSTTANQTITVTNSTGVSFNVNFFFLDLDTAGQTLPDFATSVTGVLYGFYPNYSLAVTKFSDIVTPAPSLGVSQAGNVLTFSWTAAGYNLQSQTNSLGSGLSGAGWFDYPDPSNPVNVTVDPANPTVFFRLHKP